MTDEERPTPSRCAFCGGADASHRVRDAMLERFMAGDELINIQLDFEDPQAQVKIRQAMKEREATARAEGVAEGRAAGLREAAQVAEYDRRPAWGLTICTSDGGEETAQQRIARKIRALAEKGQS